MPAPAQLLAVDVGGTRIKSATIDSAGRAETVHMVDTEPDPERLADTLAGLVRASAGPWALALPGPVADGVWQADRPFAKAAVPIAELLAARGVPAPLVMAQDTDAALAGQADGESLGLLQLSTGIGVAVAVDGRPLRDASGDLAGLWLAHLPLADAPPCVRCGGVGCVSARTSLTGLSVLLEEQVSPADVRDAPEGTLRSWAYRNALLATADLAGALVMLFRVPEVRFGGGSAAAWWPDLEPVVAARLADLPAGLGVGVAVTLAGGDERAPLQGLAALARG